MTASKFATKPTASATKQRRARVQPVERMSAQQEYAEDVARAQEKLMAQLNVPTERRRAVATVSALLLGASSYYWGIQVTGWLMAGALTFTGSAFIAFMIAVIGTVAAFASAWSLGARTYKFVCDFDVEAAQATGQAIKDAARSKVSLVRGWFARNDQAADVIAV